jgi:hypothetical protein
MNFYKTIIFLCCLFFSASVGFAQKTKTKSEKFDAEAVQKEILRLEELGRTKSLGGDTDWDDLWADGAYIIDPFGTIIVYQKGQNLSAGGLVLKSLKLSDMIVRAYGEVAVVTALMEIESETADKKPLSFKLRFMHVWKKFDDGWKIVVAERTPVRQIPK